VPRAATKLTRLVGTLTVTASERMLAFAFDDLAATGPATKEQAGVAVTLRPPRVVDDRLEAQLELAYRRAGRSSRASRRTCG
jgi:hypothetical protein